MSIAEKITELNTVKTDIFSALETKGVTVPENAGLSATPNLIGQIVTGSASPYVNIGGRDYPYVQIGSRYFLMENLDYKFDGLTIGESQDIYEVTASYYDNNETAHGVNGDKWGLLYSRGACVYLVEHPALLPDGWRVCSNADYAAIFAISGTDSSGLKKICKNVAWEVGPTAYGTNETQFTAVPSGQRNTNGTFGQGNIEATFVCSDSATAGNTQRLVLSPSGRNFSGGYSNVQSSIRLCKTVVY